MSKSQTPTERKKRIEAHFLEEARRASTVFPAGELKHHEKPGFLLLTDRGKLGIDVTEFCREDPRAEAGRLSTIRNKARELFSHYLQAEPVDVSLALGHADVVASIATKLLTQSLADFPHHTDNGKAFEQDHAARRSPISIMYQLPTT